MPKIMIIDDSAVIRRTVTGVLESGGYEVLQASSGAEAIILAESHPDINLVICDYNMPEMDGLTCCERLKAMNELSSIPILILTTQTSANLRQKAKEMGLTGWIIKPFHPEKALKVIDKLTSVY